MTDNLFSRRSLRVEALMITGVIAACAYVAHLVAGGIFDALSSALGKFPSHGPNGIIGPGAADIYGNLMQPDTVLTSADIVNIYVTSPVVTENPFEQLHQIASLTILAITWGICLAALTGIIVLRVFLRESKRVRQIFPWALLGIATVFWVLVPFTYTTFVGRGPWDEVYLLATQARSFAETGLWSVPISGPRGIAESSADTAVTLAAGLFMKLFPTLQAETALVLAYSVLVGVLSFCIAFVFIRWHQRSAVYAVFVTSLVVAFNPSGLLSTSQGMPTAVAAAALALFGLVVYQSFQQQSAAWLAIFTLPFGLIRWEFGVLTIIAALLVGTSMTINWIKNRPTSRNTIATQLGFLAVPFVYFASISLFRRAAFGSWMPSGVAYKNVGFDASFISNGISYFAGTSRLTMWTWILAMSIALLVVYVRSHPAKLWALVATTLLACAPLANSILAGGDWFPADWQRYVLPSLTAVVVLTFALIPDTRWSRLSRYSGSIGLAAVVCIAQLTVFSNVVSLFATSTPDAVRTNCLAEAGTMVSGITAPGDSVATAEVNTVSFFADRQVTDLIGLVDPRTAHAPLAPREPGDALHRRALPQLIQIDQPAVIYLYEAASCASTNDQYVDASGQSDVDAWNALLNQAITKYRIGSITAVLETYTPVTYTAAGEIQLRLLVRKDLVQE